MKKNSKLVIGTLVGIVAGIAMANEPIHGSGYVCLHNGDILGVVTGVNACPAPQPHSHKEVSYLKHDSIYDPDCILSRTPLN